MREHEVTIRGLMLTVLGSGLLAGLAIEAHASLADRGGMGFAPFYLAAMMSFAVASVGLASSFLGQIARLQGRPAPGRGRRREGCEPDSRSVRMECYPSPWKLLGLFAMTCLMVGMSYCCTTLPAPVPKVVGWSGVAFFGLGFVAIPRTLSGSGPRVVIDRDGLEDRRSKLGVIPGGRSAPCPSTPSNRPPSWASSSMIPRSTRAACRGCSGPWSRQTRALDFPTLAISFAGLTPGLEAAWCYIQEMVGIDQDASGAGT